MLVAPLSTNETARLARLLGLDVLGTEPETELDALTGAASLACGVPVDAQGKVQRLVELNSDLTAQPLQQEET